MELLRRAAAAVLLCLFVVALPFAANAHNITHILEKEPDFTTFNHYLTVTQLAAEINRRETITVCAVDNAGMADLLKKGVNVGAMKKVLSLHVLLDYFDGKKLHDITNGTAVAATMFQATGSATGAAGFVNITDLKGGKVGFAPKDNNGEFPATFVRTVQAIPYNISVIQISSILPSAEAEAPAPAPTKTNITSVMAAHGCKVFADTLAASPAAQTYDDNVFSGLTIFCPGDDAMKSFLPKYKNLTASGKQSLLEFHAMPIYESLSGLKSSNGLTNTLATDGASKFDFNVQNDGTDVTLVTKLVTAKIVNTLFDETPLAIYELNKVLIPLELFKGALPPAPAPAPEADAESPKPSKKKHKASAKAADSPADSPDGDVADQTADNGAVRFNHGIFGAVIVSVVGALLTLDGVGRISDRSFDVFKTMKTPLVG